VRSEYEAVLLPLIENLEVGVGVSYLGSALLIKY
jgi:hypothetical protein